MRRAVFFSALAAACGGGGTQPIIGDPFQSPEGGELRIERAHVPASISPAGILVTAHAYFLDPTSSTDQPKLPELGRCNDLRDSNTRWWPLVLPEQAVFADVGATIQVGGVTFLRDMGRKGIGFRQDTLGIGYFPTEADLAALEPAQTHTLSLNGTPAPEPSTVTLAAELEPTESGTVTFHLGEDKKLTFRLQNGTIGERDTIVALFLDAGEPTVTHFCASAAQPSPLEITIPATIFGEIHQQGLFLIGTHRHETSIWQNRRFDRVTIDWHIRAYEVR